MDKDNIVIPQWNANDYIVEPLSAICILRSRLSNIKLKREQLCELFYKNISEPNSDVNLIGAIYEDIEGKTRQEIVNYSSNPFVEKTVLSRFLIKMESVESSFDKQILTLSQKD